MPFWYPNITVQEDTLLFHRRSVGAAAAGVGREGIATERTKNAATVAMHCAQCDRRPSADRDSGEKFGREAWPQLFSTRVGRSSAGKIPSQSEEKWMENMNSRRFNKELFTEEDLADVIDDEVVVQQRRRYANTDNNGGAAGGGGVDDDDEGIEAAAPALPPRARKPIAYQSNVKAASFRTPSLNKDALHDSLRLMISAFRQRRDLEESMSFSTPLGERLFIPGSKHNIGTDVSFIPVFPAQNADSPTVTTFFCRAFLGTGQLQSIRYI
ncbi:MAG: hypothetical protein GY740_11320 [Gammaproteobacteria bacterium]|nr:hypothetical protein [Gammaproteobacteria bacterium]